MTFLKNISHVPVRVLYLKTKTPFMKWKQYFLPIFLVLSSCSSQKTVTTAPEQRVVAKFDYSPPSRAQVGSTNLTIALLRPRFVDRNYADPEYLAPPYNDMASSMAADFEELLTAKGFTIKGPFNSRDEMVYTDKMNSNFALEIVIDLNSSQINRTWKFDPGFGAFIAPSYKMSGDIILAGNLLITASSPQYGEKIWKKSIKLDNLPFSYVGSIKWNNNYPSLAQELRQDNVVYNAFARALEKYYNTALNLVWQQIEPIEMKSVSDQAKKADKKGS